MGDRYQVRSGNVYRNYAWVLEQADRAKDSAGAAPASRLYQLPRHHRCLPAISMDERFFKGSRADSGRARQSRRKMASHTLLVRGFAEGAGSQTAKENR